MTDYVNPYRRPGSALTNALSEPMSQYPNISPDAQTAMNRGGTSTSGWAPGALETRQAWEAENPTPEGPAPLTRVGGYTDLQAPLATGNALATNIGNSRGLTPEEIQGAMAGSSSATALVNAAGGVDQWIQATQGGTRPVSEWGFDVPTMEDWYASQGAAPQERPLQRELSTPVEYFGAGGQPYTGEGNSYWYNQADQSWYEGTPGGDIRGLDSAPWEGQGDDRVQPPGTVQPPGGGPISSSQTPGNMQYYNASGGPYSSGDSASYWYNQADGTWYEGLPDGSIRSIGNTPPWQNSQVENDQSAPEGAIPEDPRLTNLLRDYINPPEWDELADVESGRYNEQLQSALSARKRELAERLGSSGVSGGYGMSALQDLDEQGMGALSQGLSGIQQNAMARRLGRQDTALDVLQNLQELRQGGVLGQRGLNIERELGTRGQDLQRYLGELGNQTDLYGLGLQETAQALQARGLDMDFIVSLMQLMQSGDQADRDAAMQILNLLLNSPEEEV